MQAIVYRIFYKDITLTKPAYFFMAYYHTTLHDLNADGNNAIHTPEAQTATILPYCYYPQQ
jgi:hypothetical protein